MTGRSGGTEGNERLTAATGAVLVVLLAVEGVTIVFLRPLFGLHVFVGMLLVPLVLAKLASTGYRFVRYYTGAGEYQQKGPPQPLLRLLGPVVVLSTIVVFVSGIVLVVGGSHSRLLIGVHKASFVLWFAAMTVHVLTYVWRVPRLVGKDWSRRARDTLAGRRTRRLVLVAALAAGVALGAATLPQAAPWLHSSRLSGRLRER
ncbi:MAG: hypothetical protein ACYDAQ_00970 [Mycobacteriales bacterium]